MARRIDSLTAGEKVTLKVHNSSSNNGYILPDVYFVRIDGSGDTREAVFAEHATATDGFSIYRANGRWAIASDARKVTLVA